MNATPETFDLVVIGSGPAGEKGAAAAAYFGKRVALIEKETNLGGAAANTGTLPSKTLRETAVILSGLRQRKLFGLTYSLKTRVSVSDFLAHERVVRDYERARVQFNLERHNVSLYRGSAKFVDEHTLAVTPDRCEPTLLRAEKVLISTGSYPYRPPTLYPFSNPRVYDSDTILSIQEIPPSLLVIGGGVIGCEYACMFSALGVQVSVVEKRPGLLGGIDGEVSASLQEQMSSSGMQMFVNDEVESVLNAPPRNMQVKLQSGQMLETGAILVSSGRCGQTTGLGLDQLGIEVTKRGHVIVNEHFQTKQPHIYAAGDVVGNPALASTAMAQGRMAVAHAFSLPFMKGLADLLPSGIYTIPECSMIGSTEEQLREKNIPYIVGKALYANNARGQIIGDSKGFLKLLFRPDDMKLLGVHIIGEQATELVHIGQTAMLTNAPVDIFIHTCYNYPTLSELYKYAAYDALGKRPKA